MHFAEYQNAARRTDQVPTESEQGHVVPLLGLAGEVGSLLAEYKKHLRDGIAHRHFKEQVAEDLGDLLWYLSNVATKFGLDLEVIAQHNLAKTRDRWPPAEGGQQRLHLRDHLFDDGCPALEQIPRQFEVVFSQTTAGPSATVVLTLNGVRIGDQLTDNAIGDDGYRFHDAFHLGFAAILGWSPITRGLLKRKRKSQPSVDEVEDGGRAGVVEEAISALCFDYARKHSYLEGIGTLDYQLLKMIKSLTSSLEVRARSYDDWERAILGGFSVWRELRRCGGGTLRLDLIQRTVVFCQ